MALSTLPAVWLGAEPLRIAESLAAALFTVLEAEVIYVGLQGEPGHAGVAVAQVGLHKADPALAAALGPRLLDWARTHDPEDVLVIPRPAGPDVLRFTSRPVALGAEYGVIAAGFAGDRAPEAVHHLLLNIAVTQATTTIENVRLMQSLRRYTGQLTGLAEATGAMLLTSGTMEEVLQVITDRAREVVGAHQALTCTTTGPDVGDSVMAVSLSDKYAAYRTYQTPPDGSGIYSVACSENRVFRLTQDELEAHPAWRGFGGEAGKHPPMRGWLAAPLIRHDGSNLGLIQLSDKEQGEFTEQDEALLLQLARMAALIIEQRAAVAAQQVAIREAERARAEAEAASRAKDEFLAMLGHELRNPLAPIQTALQLMRLRGDAGAERERVVIERQVQHLTSLVDDLLDVSRIARGKVELRRERLELAPVVARAIEMASPLLEQRRHTVDVRVPRAGLQVEGDALRLAQVISNLLTNAAKYTEAGGLVTIQAVRAGDEVSLAVRDSGIGIAPDVLPRIFELFVQSRQALDRSQGGLGLGLTIVRSLVAMHGGTVTVHSEGLGRGTEMTVRLPAAAGEASTAGDRAAGAGADVQRQASGTRVLVVDDNEDAADMLMHALTVQGYHVRAAHDGPAAIQICAEFHPRIALLDIGLPVMDGYELAGQLRRRYEGALHLIAVTGYGQASDRQRSRAAGFDQHLVKPIDLDALERILRDIPATTST